MLSRVSSFVGDPEPERPDYHVMPKRGWMNDPNGPFYCGGRYHVFYQHIPEGCEWDFGIVWGHAISTDLVHWEHLPNALKPSPGGLDADGCFSGCAIVDTDGTPTILYTGVRLRSNPECGPLPPPECDLNLPFIESQLCAVASVDDHNCVKWRKVEEPFIALPPSCDDVPDMVGWRDPYIFEVKGEGDYEEWGILIGSGHKTTGGSVMIYRSKQLSSGWRFEGMLCEASNVDNGVMWECPLLMPLPYTPEPTRSLSSHREQSSDEHRRSAEGSEPETPPAAPTHPIPSDQHERDAEKQAPLAQIAQDKLNDSDAESSQPDEPPPQVQDDASALARQALQTFRRISMDGPSSPRRTSMSSLRRVSFSGEPSLRRVSFSEAPTSPIPAPPRPSGRTAYETSPLRSGSHDAEIGGSLPRDPAVNSLIRRSRTITAEAEEAGARRRSNQFAGRSTLDLQALEQGWSQVPQNPQGVRRRISGLGRPAPARPSYTHLLTISPDAPTNPVLYWLGNMAPEGTRFLFEGAKGPLHLDLGDVLYAPNIMVDHKGRHILWGWLQERRKVGTYNYAGCLGVPRMLRLQGERFIQEPIPELDRLHRGDPVILESVDIPEDLALPVEGIVGPSLDIRIELHRGSATSAGLIVRSWNAEEGDAAVLFDWEKNRLEVRFSSGDNALDLSAPVTEDSVQRSVGGHCQLREGEHVQMRIMLDHSCVEIFMASGEVLSTRIYRGSIPIEEGAGLDFVAFGGTAHVAHMQAWQVGTVWKRLVSQDAELGAFHDMATRKSLPHMQGLRKSHHSSVLVGMS